MNRALVVVIAFCILASTALGAYIATTPKDQPFTDFYILGPYGTAANYSTQYLLGAPQPVTIGIENHEYRDMQYTLVVTLNSSTRSTTLYSTNVSVGDNQTWQQTIQVKPDQVGDQMKLAFLLYANNNYSTPYRELHTWVNVTA